MSSVRAEDAIKAVRRQMVRRRDALTQEWQQARDIARQLCDAAKRRLGEVRDELTREMGSLLRGATFFVDDAEDHDERSHYFRSQIVEAARKLDYFANMETYRSWTRLVIRSADHDQSELLVAFPWYRSGVPGSPRLFRDLLSARRYRRGRTASGFRGACLGGCIPNQLQGALRRGRAAIHALDRAKSDSGSGPLAIDGALTSWGARLWRGMRIVASRWR